MAKDIDADSIQWDIRSAADAEKAIPAVPFPPASAPVKSAAESVGNRRIFERLSGGGYVYRCIDEPLDIEVRYVRREGAQTHAEINVRCQWPGVHHHKGSISCADMNLSALGTRKSLAKHCKDRTHTTDADFDWVSIIDATCIEVIEAERQGDQVIVLDDAPDHVEINYDVAGLQIPSDATSLLIANGGGLKSLIMLYVLGTLAQRGVPVLYLDWEWSPARHKQRKQRLFGSARLEGLHYRRCRGPLIHQLDWLHRFCDANQIRFLAVDSVTLACDGKLIDDDVATRFHRTLSYLPASLCAAHVPKSSLNPENKSDPIGPFGSIHFYNLCRASWFVKKEPGDNSSRIRVGLFRDKQNDGDPTAASGLEFVFHPHSGPIDVQPVDLNTVDGLAEKLPLGDRLKNLCRTKPGRTWSYDEAAEELGAKADSVAKAVKRNTDMVLLPGGLGKAARFTYTPG